MTVSIQSQLVTRLTTLRILIQTFQSTVVTRSRLRRSVLNIRPQKFCSHAGCHALIDYAETYCEKHRKQKSHETMLKHKRNDKFEPLYHSSQWRKTSLLYREHNPFCEECLRHGKHTLGTSVDHIESLKLGGDPFDWDNLQTLCAKCHNAKTREEQKYYENINKQS